MSALDGDDSPIRVQVTPSQTAYFAGEPFSVVITFTNTRSASAQPPAGPSRAGHKRNAHSISSAPIALPPTSPAGQPRTPTTAVNAYGGGSGQGTQGGKGKEGRAKIARRGLIGKDLDPKGKEELPDLIEQRRKRLLAKSLSLTISPGDLEAEIGAGVLRSAGHDRNKFTSEEQSPSSPLSRSESLSLASNHPHARKRSVLDGSVPLFTTTTTPSTPAKSPLSVSVSAPAVASSMLGSSGVSSEPTTAKSNSNPLPQSSSASSSVPPSPSTPTATTSASTSTFSLALDPIEERSPSPYSPSPSSPFPPSQPSQYATYPYSYPYQYPSAPGTPNMSMAAMPPPSISIQSPSPQKQENGRHDRLLGPDIGLGRPPDRDKKGKPEPLFSASNSSSSIAKGKGKEKEPLKPNSEVILYSYVQLKGSVVITPLPAPPVPPYSNSQSLQPHPHQSPQPPPPPLPPPTTALALLRTTLLRGSVSAIGGGSMEIGSSLSSLSGSISAGSIPGSLSSPSLGGIPRHRRSPSLAGLVLTGFGLGTTPATPIQGEYLPSEAPKGPTPLDAVPRRGQTHRRTASARPAPLGEQDQGRVRSSSSAGLWTSLWGTPAKDENPTSPTHEEEGSGGDTVSPLQTISRNGLPTGNRSRAISAGAAPTSTSGWPASHPYGQPPLTPSSSFSKLFGWSSTSSLNAPTPSIPTSNSTPASASVSTPQLSSGSAPTSWWDKGGKEASASGGWRSVIGFDSRGLVDKEVDPETPLPTFEVQPAMLGVDLTLGPGESRSYKYTLYLPDNLPPTFRGRQIRFSYELVVGTCRADGGKIGSGSGSISKVMKVPIRVYNNVSIGGPPSSYELLWPALLRAKRRQGSARTYGRIRGHRRGGVSAVSRGKPSDEHEGKVEEIDGAVKGPESSPKPNTATGASGVESTGEAEDKLHDLKEYATKLLSGVPTKSSTGLLEKEEAEKGLGDRSTSGSTPGRMGVYRKSSLIVGDDWDDDGSEDEDGEGIGKIIRCGEAVEILTRTQKKVSYDVHKDDVKVAVFTLVKSAFRLGETVLGVVEVNERSSRSRVLQLSAHLETHETLPTTISSLPLNATSKQQLKRVHAEHHTNFVLGSLRTTFSLDIPSDATPAFQVRVGEDEVAPPHVIGTTVPLTAPASVANFPTSSLLPSTIPTPALWPWPETGKAGGLEWKVRLCLLVAIASETADTGTEGVPFKTLVRDGMRGEWASPWTAPLGAGVMQKPKSSRTPMKRGNSNSSMGSQNQGMVRSWASYLTSSILGSVEESYHNGDEDPEGYEDTRRGEGDEDGYDGIKPDPMGGVGSGVDYAGGREDEWEEVKIETVECEVPIRVWPGNTAFRPMDVVFDV
ncbi:retrograde golgi transport protein rgp1-like protein [Moniliophthora roreri]|uniref:Rgp1-domain-containing protein n=1 Tax=Moniliophthora roreri TaxID=221103 RepID=A0A0W0F2F4_MONRR|nr:retrograde golgi transport protein rgp1-like protein [Moniliophthora roreri]